MTGDSSCNFCCAPYRKRVAPIVGMQQGSTPKQMTAYRQMLKDRIQCPDCGSIMTIRSLHYRHKCKPAGPNPEKLEHMRQKATEAATAAHARRMAKARAERRS
jgi:hypothetical protein